MNTLGGISLVGCEVWYTYYDAGSNADECRRMNPDVILSPDQIPLSKMDYSYLNEPTKVIVRKIFFSKAKNALAMVRGKFSGKIPIPEAEGVLDYSMLTSQAKDDYTEAMDELRKRLERMSPYTIMQKNAELTDNMAKIMKQKPMWIITV